MDLNAKLEAILFYKGEPVSRKRLCDMLGCDEAGLAEAATALRSSLGGRGIELVESEEGYVLGTASALAPLIETVRREELSRDLGKAGLETLAIVLYKGPISRREIDYIRGVNSAFIVRNLMVRGLVERIEGGGKERGYLYGPTTELLMHMGISRREDLPEYDAVRREIDAVQGEAPDPQEES